MNKLRRKIQSFLAEHHLTLLGLVPLGKETSYPHFATWLREGKHAGMRFFEKDFHSTVRADPRLYMEGAKSAILVALAYDQGQRKSDFTANSAPNIASYARLKDYHKVVRHRLNALGQWLKETHDPELNYRASVDTAPILERALAARTAEGFIGKNSMYIHPQKGSYFMLGLLITDAALEYDQPAGVNPSQRSPKGGCGSCRRCQTHCPTGALNQDYTVDARRCLSYYSIEHREVVPREFWPYFAHSLFGCDLCQAVCPYNRKATRLSDPSLIKVQDLPSYARIACMSQDSYIQWFGGTSMTRAGRDGLRRNALIAMAATRDPELESVCQSLQKDPSPLIQETLAQIASNRPPDSPPPESSCKENVSRLSKPQ